MDTPDITAALSEIRQLRDRNELLDLVDGYFFDSDRGRFDNAWAASVFTNDVEMVFPVTTHRGLDGIADVHQRAFDRYESTQHLPCSHIGTVTENEAVIRSSVLIFHVHLAETREQRGDDSLFIVGHDIEARAVRTGLGWRIQRLGCKKIWHSGQPPAGLPGGAVSPYGSSS